MSGKRERAGEFELIERYFAPLSGEGAFGLRDDAALIVPPNNRELVITHDTILEGIHFLPDDDPESIGRKALRVNLSDLFAKGAEPLGYTLSLGLPDHWDEAHVAGLAKGLGEDQAHFGAELFGGDTYRSPDRACIGIAMTGSVPPGSYVDRLSASPDEIVAVTGTIGDGALGLDVCTGLLDIGEHNDWLAGRYRVPDPRAAHAALVREFATAAMDISDGLLGDLAKLCAASGLSASIERGDVPLSDAGRAAIALDDSRWKRVIAGGDDYEVLFTLPGNRLKDCMDRAAKWGTQVTAIGKTVDGPEGAVTLLVNGQPQPYGSGSYSHF